MVQDKPKFIIYDASESVLQSFIKDAITFGFILLCILALVDRIYNLGYIDGKRKMRADIKQALGLD